MTTCRFAHLDGAYVLGALPPAERQDFEGHLTGCVDCSAAVRDLAGLPGLLARARPEVLDVPAVDPPPPSTLLPRLTAQVRARQRRRRWAVAAAAAAALVAVAVAVGALGTPSLLDDSGPGQPPPAAAPSDTARSMTPLRDVPLTAEVSLEEVAWGTRLSLTCRYATTRPDPLYGGPATAAPRYALVVHTRGGGTEQVATWRAVPGRTLEVDAATAAAPADIERIEVRTTDGVAVLRLTS